MSRRIETGPKISNDGSIKLSADSAETGSREGYLSRLVKYIPSETVGGYVATLGFVPSPKNSETATTVLWLLLIGWSLLTPVILGFTTRDPKQKKGPLWIQVVLGTIAFPVWAFALGGPFETLSWYSGNKYISSIMLVFVTALFGIIDPPRGS